MPNNIGAAALSGMSSVAGALISANSAKKQALANIAYQERAQAKQREQALADRAHDETYNSAAAQKMRLLNAGLSPTEYTQNVATDSEGMVPDYTQPMSNFGGDLVNASMLQGQSAPLAMQSSLNAIGVLSQAKKNLSDSKLTEGQSKLLDARFSDEVLALQISNDLKLKEIDEKFQAIENLKQEHRLTGRKVEEADLYNQYLRDTYNARVYAMDLDNQLKQSNIDLNAFQLNFKLPAEVEHLASLDKLNSAQAAQCYAYASQARQAVEFMQLQGESLSLDMIEQSFKNTVFEETVNDQIGLIKNNKSMSDKDKKWQGVRFGLEIAESVLGSVESATKSFENVMFGLKGIGGSPTPPTKFEQKFGPFKKFESATVTSYNTPWRP